MQFAATCGPHGPRVGRWRRAVTHVLDEWPFTTEPGLQADSFLLQSQGLKQSILDLVRVRELIRAFFDPLSSQGLAVVENGGERAKES